MDMNKKSFLEPEVSLLDISSDIGTEPTSGPDMGGGDDWGLPEL